MNASLKGPDLSDENFTDSKRIIHPEVEIPSSITTCCSSNSIKAPVSLG
jgi:hypothetical protein